MPLNEVSPLPFLFSFSLDNVDEIPVVEAGTRVVAESGSTDSNGDVSHPFRLRPEKTISLTLPTDLTPQEAQRLSDFVKTLPLSV